MRNREPCSEIGIATSSSNRKTCTRTVYNAAFGGRRPGPPVRGRYGRVVAARVASIQASASAVVVATGPSGCRGRSMTTTGRPRRRAASILAAAAVPPLLRVTTASTSCSRRSASSSSSDEGAAADDRRGDRERRLLDGLDRAHQHLPARKGTDGSERHPSQGEEGTARPDVVERASHRGEVAHAMPVVAGLGGPRRAQHAEPGRAARRGRFGRVPRHPQREGVGRVHEQVHAGLAQVPREAGDAAEPAGAHLTGQVGRCAGHAGERADHGHVVPRPQVPGERRRLGRAREQQQAGHAGSARRRR